MKTIIYTLILSIALVLLNGWNMPAQSDTAGLQTLKAKKYMQQSDSLNSDNSSKLQAGTTLRNKGTDSLIQVLERKRINRMYLGDSDAIANKGELDSLVRQLMQEQNNIRNRVNSNYSWQKSNLDSILNGHVNVYQDRVRFLDSLEIQYEYMVSNSGQFTNEEIQALNGEINQVCTQLDSMLQIRSEFCWKYQLHLDSVLNSGQIMIDSLYQNRQAEIDAFFRIKSQTKFKITEKNTSSGQSQKNKTLAEVVEEIVLIDSNLLRFKFCKKLAEPQEIQSLFKYYLSSLLKSVLTEAKEIGEIEWNNEKADILQITTLDPVLNPNLIEIEYDGVVELNENDEIILKSAENTTNMKDLKNVTLNIYPNPAFNCIRLSNTENLINVMIYNINGMMVKDICDLITKEIVVSDLPVGVYILKATYSQGENLITKFIKQ